MVNHYHTLGLSHDASPEQIVEAFERERQRMGSFAPGVEITDELIRLNNPFVWEAFVVLSDPDQKAAYDALHAPPKIGETSEPVKTTFREKFISYVAVIGLTGAIILFLAFLGNYLI